MTAKSGIWRQMPNVSSNYSLSIGPYQRARCKAKIESTRCRSQKCARKVRLLGLLPRHGAQVEGWKDRWDKKSMHWICRGRNESNKEKLVTWTSVLSWDVTSLLASALRGGIRSELINTRRLQLKSNSWNVGIVKLLFLSKALFI